MSYQSPIMYACIGLILTSAMWYVQHRRSSGSDKARRTLDIVRLTFGIEHGTLVDYIVKGTGG